jgi:hypothetical protein
MLGAGPSLDPSILGLRDANSAKVETPNTHNGGRTVLSHSTRGRSRESEASTVPSYRDEAAALLTWLHSTNGMWICLMIDETTDGADCLVHLRHRR